MQWVKGPALLQMWFEFNPLAQERPYIMDAALQKIAKNSQICLKSRFIVVHDLISRLHEYIA